MIVLKKNKNNLTYKTGIIILLFQLKIQTNLMIFNNYLLIVKKFIGQC